MVMREQWTIQNFPIYVYTHWQDNFWKLIYIEIWSTIVTKMWNTRFLNGNLEFSCEMLVFCAKNCSILLGKTGISRNSRFLMRRTGYLVRKPQFYFSNIFDLVLMVSVIKGSEGPRSGQHLKWYHFLIPLNIPASWLKLV